MKRPAMPLSVKLAAALLALGIDPDAVDWHHEPPLGIRPFDPATGKWTPDANDPRHIVPMARADHKARTPADQSRVAKTTRQEKKEAAFRQRLLGTKQEKRPWKRKWKSRPFPSKPASSRR